jgi:predicted transglutaminase-like cysteine proteinase
MVASPSSVPASPVRNRVCTVYLLLLAGLLAGALTGPGSALAKGTPQLFGYAEKRYPTNRKMFPKWEDMLRRLAAGKGKQTGKCKPSFFSRCLITQLKATIQKARKLPPGKQVVLIHKAVNKIKYSTDIQTYRQKDYWATIHETYQHEMGDCEDYSIAKYYALRELGFPHDALRVLVVHDKNVKLDHAVLMVELNGKKYLLDNRLKKVIAAKRVAHLKPYYAINEHNWWRYSSK